MPKRGRRDCSAPPKRSKAESSPPPPPTPLSFDSSAQLFESLIRPVTSETFFSEYWEQKPLLLKRSEEPSVALYYESLFRLSDLRGLCSRGVQYYTDVNVVTCVDGKKQVFNKGGKVKSSDLEKFVSKDKATIQFHQPQRFKDEIWRILEKLECFFGALVGSNIYITPGDSQGLPPHHDDVEVFVLQLEGKKRWLLYNPTVSLPAEYCVQSEDCIGSPTHDITLEVGDLLYFPRGTIHKAMTPAGVGHSTHLTISTYQRMSWGELLIDAMPGLVHDTSRTQVSLREGIPRRHMLSCSESSSTNKRLAAGLRTLADQLESGDVEVHSNQMKRDFIMNRLPPYSQQGEGGEEEEEELISPAGRIPTLDDSVRLRFKEHVVITVEKSQERTDEAAELVVFFLHSLKNQRDTHMMNEMSDQEDDLSGGLKFPLSHLAALRQLLQAEQLPLAQLQLSSQEAKLSMAVSLWSESLLEVL